LFVGKNDEVAVAVIEICPFVKESVGRSDEEVTVVVAVEYGLFFILKKSRHLKKYVAYIYFT
jgi:hypothetical protein